MKNILLLSLALVISFVGSVSAQSYRGQDYVTIFEDCDYRGKSRDIYVGDFDNMGRVDFGNDRVSSIQVPQGFEVTIYEHDAFRGDYARVDRNVSCFDKNWNNQVSSLRVQQVGKPNYSNNQYAQAPTAPSNATAQSVSYVAFAGRLLQKTSNSQWEMSNKNGQVSKLTEVARNQYAVYLQNRYSAQRVRIDFFTNDVTVINRNGSQQRYTMDQHYTAIPKPNYNSAYNNNYAKPVYSQPNYSGSNNSNIIQGGCFDVKAYSDGGSAGLKISGVNEFLRFNSKAYTGRVCHKGELKMEINKRNPQTSVVVEINGRPYTFSKNEKHDVYKASWYRKNLTLFSQP